MLSKYMPAVLYDDGKLFYDKVSHRLKDQTLVSILRYTPYDFSEQKFIAPHYLAIRVKSGEVTVRDIGSADDIDLQIQRYRSGIENSIKSNFSFSYKEQGHRLYEVLLAPILGEHLAAGGYVADMDGMPNLLPLEALVDGSGKFLIETASWRYVSSARALLREPAPSSTNAAVIFANPDYDLAATKTDDAKSGYGDIHLRSSIPTVLRDMKFPPLPETAEEANGIRKPLVQLGSEVTILQGPAANTAALSRINAPRYLHIASHGFYFDDAQYSTSTTKGKGAKIYTDEALSGGLNAGIALSGANTDGAQQAANGLFFLSRFRLLNLKGTELVVLSACDTGVGSVRIGEGVTSLRQSIELAGAQSTITSLWEVPSTETSDTMTRFYDELAKGKTKIDALEIAKRSTLQQHPNPAFWAGFVYAGLE
jgi:CHAT domain-containing protein